MKKFTIPLEIFKMQDGCHILARIKILNKEYRVLIDTGSTNSLINSKKIKHFTTNEIEDNNNFTYDFNGNSIKTDYITIDEILIGELELTDVRLTLIDFESFNKNFRANGLPLVDAVIGGDILFEYKCVIDYGERTMILIKN